MTASGTQRWELPRRVVRGVGEGEISARGERVDSRCGCVAIDELCALLWLTHSCECTRRSSEVRDGAERERRRRRECEKCGQSWRGTEAASRGAGRGRGAAESRGETGAGQADTREHQQPSGQHQTVSARGRECVSEADFVLLQIRRICVQASEHRGEKDSLVSSVLWIKKSIEHVYAGLDPVKRAVGEPKANRLSLFFSSTFTLAHLARSNSSLEGRNCHDKHSRTNSSRGRPCRRAGDRCPHLRSRSRSTNPASRLGRTTRHTTGSYPPYTAASPRRPARGRRADQGSAFSQRW